MKNEQNKTQKKLFNRPLSSNETFRFRINFCLLFKEEFSLCLFSFFGYIKIKKKNKFIVLFSLDVNTYAHSNMSEKLNRGRDSMPVANHHRHLCSFSSIDCSQTICSSLISDYQSFVAQCSYELQVRCSIDFSGEDSRSSDYLVVEEILAARTRHSNIDQISFYYR